MIAEGQFWAIAEFLLRFFQLQSQSRWPWAVFSSKFTSKPYRGKHESRHVFFLLFNEEFGERRGTRDRG